MLQAAWPVQSPPHDHRTIKGYKAWQGVRQHSCLKIESTKFSNGWINNLRSLWEHCSYGTTFCTFSTKSDQFHVEYQIAVWRYKSGKSLAAICFVRWNINLGSFIHTKSFHSFLQTGYHLFFSEFEAKRFLTISCGIVLLSILQLQQMKSHHGPKWNQRTYVSRVMDRNCLTLLRVIDTITCNIHFHLHLTKALHEGSINPHPTFSQKKSMTLPPSIKITEEYRCQI